MTAPIDPPPSERIPPAPEDDVLIRSREPLGDPIERDVPPQASMPRLWFAVLGGVVAYVVHLAGIYWPLERCTPVDRPVAAIATALAVVVAAAATVVGVRALAALPARFHGPAEPGDFYGPAEPGEQPEPGWDPVPDATLRRTLAVSGIVLSGLALLILLLVAVAVIVVPPCV